MPKAHSDHFKPRRRVERDYGDQILKLIYQVVFPTFTHFNIEMPTEEMINADLGAAANRLATQMVTAVSAQNAQSWREAASIGTKGRMIHRLIQQEMNGHVGDEVRRMIKENAALIRSVPLRLGEDMTRFIATQQRAGKRSPAITEMLRAELPRMSEKQATLIARTETAKAETTLTRARSEALDIYWYQWLTSEDSRVRPSHQLMDHVLIPWAQPPAPEQLAKIKSTLGHYHAGMCPNCRCPANPLVRLNRIQFPARVYQGGALVRMTETEFRRTAGIAERVAA